MREPVKETGLGGLSGGFEAARNEERCGVDLVDT
jgi:hypothetical protein